MKMIQMSVSSVWILDVDFSILSDLSSISLPYSTLVYSFWDILLCHLYPGLPWRHFTMLLTHRRKFYFIYCSIDVTSNSPFIASSLSINFTLGIFLKAFNSHDCIFHICFLISEPYINVGINVLRTWYYRFIFIYF